MKIKSVETFVIKLKRAIPYLGHRPQEDRHGGDYFFQKGYHCLYSKKYESLLVKITLDNGLYGWGEALAPVGGEVTAAVVKKLLQPLLLGENPEQVECLWHRMYNSMRERGHTGGFMVDGITAVDVALWDIIGRLHNRPVAQLLGGIHHRSIPAYVSGLTKDSVQEQLALAQTFMDKGFSRFKLHLGQGVEADANLLAALRQGLGPDVYLACDAHWMYTVSDAIRLGQRLAAVNVGFLEAPTEPEDLTGCSQVAAQIPIPVAVGEGERTRYEFRERMLQRCASIYQPDVGRCGLTEGRVIGHLAATFHYQIAPHLSAGLGITTAASIQYAASLNNLLFLEYQPNTFAPANQILQTPLTMEAGCFLLPQGPGLGVEVDEQFVRRESLC